jgi:uncharacterized protein YwgA
MLREADASFLRLRHEYRRTLSPYSVLATSVLQLKCFANSFRYEEHTNSNGDLEGLALTSALDLLVALLAAGGSSARENELVRDSTRLVKLLFLLVKEGGFERFAEDFGFEKDYAHDFGPWSPQVYDYVETLKQIGFLSSEETGKEQLEEGIDDVEWAREFPVEPAQRSGMITVFQLSEKGLKVGRKILDSLPYEEKKRIIEVKSRFNKMQLCDLLEYVYLKYPEATLRSKIRGKVLTKSMFGVSPDLPKFEREEEDLREVA